VNDLIGTGTRGGVRRPLKERPSRRASRERIRLAWRRAPRPLTLLERAARGRGGIKDIQL